MSTGISLADILTTSSSVANYLGVQDIAPGHLADAIALLLGETTLEQIGRPRSPLVPRPPAGPATPQVRDFAQRWLERLDREATRELTLPELLLMREEIGVLASASPG